MKATNNYEIAHRAAGIILATLYVTTVIFALRKQWIRWLLSPLKAYGRMALTNCIGQTVIILTIMQAFHLFNKLNYVQTTLICGGIYVFQIVLQYTLVTAVSYGTTRMDLAYSNILEDTSFEASGSDPEREYWLAYPLDLALCFTGF